MLSSNGLKLHLALRKAIHGGGTVDDFFRDVGDLSGADLQEFLDSMEKRATIVAKITAIGKKYRFKKSETVESMLKRAAAKGDEDARSLLASDILDMRLF
jgi:hypothetical protein